MKYISVLVLTSIVFFAGCTESPEEFVAKDPLPPVGTRALFAADNVGGVGFGGVIDASDVESGHTPNPYFCRLTDKTSIRSVHNHKNNTLVYVILEENSRKESSDATKPEYQSCRKGAIIQIHADEFTRSIGYLKMVEDLEQEQREAQKKIREELLKQQQ